MTRDEYVKSIPVWCTMHLSDHLDGLGGCWGISHGLVAQQGERYCLRCDLHRLHDVDVPVIVEGGK